MPFIEFKNIGDVIQSSLKIGEITDIDYSKDTCTVKIDGADKSDIPVFFHCDSNIDKVEFGSHAFIKGDSVVVLCKNDIAQQVIAHEAGKYPCCDLVVCDYIFPFYVCGVYSERKKTLTLTQTQTYTEQGRCVKRYQHLRQFFGAQSYPKLVYTNLYEERYGNAVYDKTYLINAFIWECVYRNSMCYDCVITPVEGRYSIFNHPPDYEIDWTSLNSWTGSSDVSKFKYTVKGSLYHTMALRYYMCPSAIDDFITCISEGPCRDVCGFRLNEYHTYYLDSIYTHKYTATIPLEVCKIHWEILDLDDWDSTDDNYGYILWQQEYAETTEYSRIRDSNACISSTSEIVVTKSTTKDEVIVEIDGVSQVVTTFNEVNERARENGQTFYSACSFNGEYVGYSVCNYVRFYEYFGVKIVTVLFSTIESPVISPCENVYFSDYVKKISLRLYEFKDGRFSKIGEVILKQF